MRSHPIAGAAFVLVGLGLLALGAMGPPVPGFLDKAPMRGLLMPFVLWQLAVWSLLFGVFFLRSRAPPKRAKPLGTRPTFRL